MKNKDKIINLFSIMIILGFSMLLLYFGRISYIWYDESFTMNIVQHPVREIISLTSLDVHPPLYYLVVKLLVSVLGFRTIAFHIPSILFIAAILVEILVFLNKYADSRTALFTIIGFISVPQITKYSLELRMYGMCMFLILSSVLVIFSMLKDFDEKEGVYFSWKWILLTIIQVACAYTHYFAGVAAVGSSVTFLIYMLIRYKKPGKIILFWIAYGFGMLVLYLPWISILFKQMSSINDDYWIQAPTLSELKTYLNEVFATGSPVLTILLIVVFFLGILFFFIFRKKDTLMPWIGLCYGTIGFWLLFGFGYSILVSPILVSRYLVMLLPILWIPILYTIMKNNKIYLNLIIVAFLCVLGFNNTKPVLTEYWNSDQMFLRAYLDENLDKEKDAFFSFYMQDMSIQAAYYPGVPQYLMEGRDANEAFKNWPLLVNCHYINDFNELHEIEGNIWCQDGLFLGAFTEAGYSVEEISVGRAILYRIYME